MMQFITYCAARIRLATTWGLFAIICMAANVAHSQITPTEATETKEDKPLLIYAGDLYLVVAPDERTVLAYSRTNGKWSRHTFPEGVKVEPVVTHGVIGFGLAPATGKSIKELVAVDKNGAFVTQKLEKPLTTRCVPIIGHDMLVVQAAGNAYGFSATRSRWAVTPTIDKIAINDSTAWMQSKDKIAIFSSPSARWAVADIPGP